MTTSLAPLAAVRSGPAAILRGPRGVSRETVVLPGGGTIAYAETGSGPPIILIHGTLVTLEDMWLGPATALDRHFRVIAVDRPGTAEASGPGTGTPRPGGRLQ